MTSIREIGTEGEAVIREWLLKNGYSFIPTSLIQTGSAPMLEGPERIILPDNLTWREGPRWVEVKTKSHASKKTHQPYKGRWEHGIPLRHWNHYCMVQDKTKTPVTLVILQLDKKLLFVARLNSIQKNARLGQMANEPHIFFDVRDFEEIYQLADDYQTPQPLKAQARTTLRQHDDEIFEYLSDKMAKTTRLNGFIRGDET